jgi:hypothetical protein
MVWEVMLQAYCSDYCRLSLGGVRLCSHPVSISQILRHIADVYLHIESLILNHDADVVDICILASDLDNRSRCQQAKYIVTASRNPHHVASASAYWHYARSNDEVRGTVSHDVLLVKERVPCR